MRAKKQEGVMQLSSKKILGMGIFLENFGKVLMGVASLLPTFPPS
jgi:hypothetical protein